MIKSQGELPDALHRTGHVYFAAEDAALCFDVFAAWARRIAEVDYIDYSSVLNFYVAYGRKNADEFPTAPRPSTSALSGAWIDPSRYVPSQALSDGFFASKSQLELAEDTRVQHYFWLSLAVRMRGADDTFSPGTATRALDVEQIEVQRTREGEYMHCYNDGGRHRMQAMRALGAPVIPVLLRTE